MTEPIPSREVVAEPRAVLAGGPTHTSVGHERCAYYLKEFVGDNGPEPLMVCPHGEVADGGFYSEDHINRIRTTAHRVIKILDFHRGLPRINSDWKWVEALRELTR